MKLDELLARDPDAKTLFDSLSHEAQRRVRRCGESIDTLATLRDYAVNLTAEGCWPPYVRDDTKLEPELKAAWTMEQET